MKQQWLFKVLKVLGILQFLLGVAVICADVLAYYHTNLPIFAGVSTAFAFLGSGALAVASSIYISYLLMVSSLFASFISSVSVSFKHMLPLSLLELFKTSTLNLVVQYNHIA